MSERLDSEQAVECMGTGSKDCCIYVAAGPEGFICIRGTGIGMTKLSRALAGTSNAQWIPADECRQPSLSRGPE